MRIGFIINELSRELDYYTTSYLANEAAKRGHEAYMINVERLSYYENDHMGALAIKAPDKKYQSVKTYLEGIRSEKAVIEKISSSDMDVLFIRNNPAEDIEEKPWAQDAGILFGQVAVKQGVLVLNDPFSLSDAIVDKMYFQHFPPAIRPKAIITRDLEEIKDFYERHRHQIVLKPLKGSGGKDVFLVKGKKTNLAQITEAISRSGFIIAQEYLPKAKAGDVRLFMMNGKILTYKNKTAALTRINKSSRDFRNNIDAGGEVKPATVTDEMRQVAEILGPKLKGDGIFMVGLDMVGNKLIELNVMSPGGLPDISRLEKVNFGEKVISAIEQKVYYKKLYGNKLTNKELAVME